MTEREMFGTPRQWWRIIAGVASTLCVAGAATAAWILWPLPPEMLSRRDDPAVVVEDRHGLTLRSTRAPDGSRTRWIPYDAIDADLITAFVAVEDRRFWEHGGVDLRAVARAMRDNVRSRRVVSGASTITMQLARLARSDSGAPRGRMGKLRQAVWALRLERHLTKQQILEQYLNRVHLGQAAIGVGAASTLYFGASAAELSIAQAATLAGLAHAPSRDNPYVSARRARARRALALTRLRRLGYVTAADLERATSEPLFLPPRDVSFFAPHFTTRVLSSSGDAGESLAPTVRTSLDLELQLAVESEVRHTVHLLRNHGVQHAAAVVLDNESGEVLAWVGSPDFWSSDDGQTDMVVSRRQPGSALKPFVYALAFDRGFTPATVLADIPKTFTTSTGPYQPRNYDRRFRGPVRAREALASSYNVPAVELAQWLGAGSVLHTLRLAGFESLRRDAEHYGLGIALGNGDVSLIELANAYRALANGGEWRPWTWRVTPAISPMRDGVGSSRRVVTPMASALVLDILRDPVARLPGFGSATPFDFPFPVAVKTGTSRHFTDNWSVGTTRRFTVAVWAGNFSGRPMGGVSGVTGAGPLLQRVVLAVGRKIPPGQLTTPAEAGAERVSVCRLSGLRATAHCAQMAEWFAPGTAPSRYDDWERDGRVTVPDEYADWLRPGSQLRIAAAAAPVRELNGEANRADTTEAPAGFRIVSPRDGDRYSIPIGTDARYATVALRAAGAGADGVTWFVDGRRYSASRWPLEAGQHVIRARSARGATATAKIVVNSAGR